MKTAVTESVYTGKSIDEAIEEGLRSLDLSREEVLITILDKGARGFLGLGSRAAQVRLEPKIDLGGPVQSMVEEILSRMGFEAEVSAEQTGRTVSVQVKTGQTDGLLIGRKGETLDALQHVVVRMAGRQLGDVLEAVEVDVAGYRDRRRDQLVTLAESLAERVERTGRRVMTEPLPALERRIVHRTLEGRESVRTHAGGSGAERRVIIMPQGAGGNGGNGRGGRAGGGTRGGEPRTPGRRRTGSRRGAAGGRRRS